MRLQLIDVGQLLEVFKGIVAFFCWHAKNNDLEGVRFERLSVNLSSWGMLSFLYFLQAEFLPQTDSRKDPDLLLLAAAPDFNFFFCGNHRNLPGSSRGEISYSQTAYWIGWYRGWVWCCLSPLISVGPIISQQSGRRETDLVGPSHENRGRCRQSVRYRIKCVAASPFRGVYPRASRVCLFLLIFFF